MIKKFFFRNNYSSIDFLNPKTLYQYIYEDLSTSAPVGRHELDAKEFQVEYVLGP